jgi:hypothetical protein
MHARLLSALASVALLLLPSCSQDPPPAGNETESETGEPSCLDTETAEDIVLSTDQQVVDADIPECFPGRLVLTGTIYYLTPLSHVREVGILDIRYLSQLQSLEGLEQIERVGTLLVTGNNVLPALPSFPNLRQVDTISITSNDGLTDLGSFPALTTVENLIIGSNPLLPDVSGFETITSMTGNLEFTDSALIETLTGFEELGIVAGDLRIEDMAELTELAGLGVHTIGGDLTILSNPELSECIAAEFAEVTDVGGATIVDNNMSDLCQ